HDLHPTTITYRKDLFDQAGIDIASAKTWREFQELGLKFRQYWVDHGRPRWAIGLSRTAPDDVINMLQERHINVVDDEDRIFITYPRVAETIRTYAGLIAGTDKVASDYNPVAGMRYKDLANGDICALVTPDWMVGYMKQGAPELAGEIAMMQLPV